MKFKFYVVGMTQHGKDEVSSYLAKKLDLTFNNASMTAIDTFMWPVVRDSLDYKTQQEFYDNRHQHKVLMHELYGLFNRTNPSAFSEVVFEKGDIYNGIRHQEQIDKGMADGIATHVIWVDASERKDPETSDSFKLKYKDEYIWIDNNGTLEELHSKLDSLVAMLTA